MAKLPHIRCGDLVGVMNNAAFARACARQAITAVARALIDRRAVGAEALNDRQEIVRRRGGAVERSSPRANASTRALHARGTALLAQSAERSRRALIVIMRTATSRRDWRRVAPAEKCHNV